ncbi:MAG: hypothetical protein AAF638_11600, partial [Pseudomonadota bacterium]
MTNDKNNQDGGGPGSPNPASTAPFSDGADFTLLDAMLLDDVRAALIAPTPAWIAIPTRDAVLMMNGAGAWLLGLEADAALTKCTGSPVTRELARQLNGAPLKALRLGTRRASGPLMVMTTSLGTLGGDEVFLVSGLQASRGGPHGMEQMHHLADALQERDIALAAVRRDGTALRDLPGTDPDLLAHVENTPQILQTDSLAGVRATLRADAFVGHALVFG